MQGRIKNVRGTCKGIGRKISRGKGATEKTKPKNSTIKPHSTLSVPCMKSRGGDGPLLPPSADAHGPLTLHQKFGQIWQ